MRLKTFPTQKKLTVQYNLTLRLPSTCMNFTLVHCKHWAEIFLIMMEDMTLT